LKWLVHRGTLWTAEATPSDTAVAAFSESIHGQSIGRNELIRFLRGANLLRSPSGLMWDLYLVLEALKGHPFEPLNSAELKYLSLKTIFLIALSSVKRVGDLQALSISAACLKFRPNDSKA